MVVDANGVPRWTTSAVLRRAVSGQRRTVVRASAFLMGHQVGEALVPVVIGVVIDRAVEPAASAALVRWLVVLGGVFAGLSLSYRFGARANVRAMYRAAHDLRVLVTARVVHTRGGADRHQLPGALLSVATADVDRVGALNATIAGTAAAIAASTVGVVALVRVSVPLALLVLIGAPPLLALMHVVSRPLEARSGAEQAEAAGAAGVATDLVRGLRVLKGIGATRVAADRYRVASRRSLHATVRAAVAEAGFEGATTLFTGLFLAVVALVGGRLAAAGDVTVGELIAAVGLAQFLLGPISSLAGLSARLARSRASATRVAAVLDAPFAVEGGHATDIASSGGLAVHELVHGGLRDLSFVARPGELVGVVVADQVATRALVECLNRDVDPEAGSVTLGGRSFTELEPGALRATVLVAAHDADLFGGTLRDNVLLAAADEPRLSGALAASAADDVARALPRGLDTTVTEGGRSLSGGQRQRVTLARALTLDPPVLVLDEPTTAVDAVTESAIADGLRTIRSGRSTVIVTTSPGLLSRCDRVVFHADGTTVMATHRELVAASAAYRQVVLG